MQKTGMHEVSHCLQHVCLTVVINKLNELL